jgi:hypothetical protein
MKLAEALMVRADMQKKLASLRERITLNAVVQEGDTVHENPEDLIKQSFMLLDQIERLVAAVNRINLNHKLPDGATLTEAIARRDSLVQRHAILQAAIAGTRKEPSRYSTREIKWVATVNVPKLHEQADNISRQIRELNAQIQQTSWAVDIEWERGSGRA